MFKYSLSYDFFSRDSCWYSGNSTQFQVKKVGYYPNNQMVELMDLATKIKFCANLNLIIGETYNYSFDVGMHFNIKASTVNVLVNNVNIKTFRVKSTNPSSLQKVYGSFIASKLSSSFCLTSTESLINSTYTTLDHQSTFVDNMNIFANGTNTSTPLNTTNGSINSSAYGSINSIATNTTAPTETNSTTN